MRIKRGKVIPRDDGKRIEELVGAATTGTHSASVARMNAPAGWFEAPQRPDFDEIVIVVKGTLTLEVDGRRERIGAGEVGLVEKGSLVTYRNDGESPCEYWSVCAPAFRPPLAHVQNVIAVESAHRRARPLLRYVESRAAAFLDALGLSGRELSVALVGDAAIRRLNRKWRQKDAPTDVLSFPAARLPRGVPGPKPLGDVVISLDTAHRAASRYGQSLRDEVALYLAHGLLHLLGYDHEKSAAEARRMSALERRLLRRPGLIARV